ncbi:WD40/YVTN/BNR-like repeat-containing protein [Pseudomonas citronellolis]|uniref:WD40/YVTN/BNR-like repeat-containing protein n=1 Tax=Pseudomonas citronellolis TaxID=53408 RepID=UPI0023E4562F|nr:YCF48-related protein [Pseudomonas citronellolis]MDF3935694.1 YCF48-related protein [Pseudomonas citronellolis]
MRFPFTPSLACVGLGLALLAGAAPAGEFVDVLDLPAQRSELALGSPLAAITRAGPRLVVVGQRGHILYSDDAGHSWTQAEVPVSSDLTAVRFPTPEQGWAVGHDGVVLHSADGGAHWTRQLDGRRIGQLLLDFYAANPQDDNAALLEQAQRLKEQGADKPFLDLWFRDAREGFVVGAFNLILHTADGGLSWTPWNHRIDNPQGLHLTAMAALGDDLYIVGEQGLLLRLDRQRQRFVALHSPYQGSFFGVLARPGLLLAYGLRGHAVRSLDGGASWSEVNTGLGVSLTAASFDAGGQPYLFSQAGQALVSHDDGASFQALALTQRGPVSGALANPGELLLVGGRGLQHSALPVAP